MLVGYARVFAMDQSPALQIGALLDFLRQGDTLVVWKLSRLAGSLTQVIKTAADIGERGIALKVLAQNIDAATLARRLFFHMTAAFNEFERELIVENSRVGLAAAARRGRHGMRPKALNNKAEEVAEAMLRDTQNYPFIGDVIDQFDIGRAAFYRYFPPERIRQIRDGHADNSRSEA